MKKRLLSILLLFCMTLTLFSPVSAFAEEGETEAPMCVLHRSMHGGSRKP